MNGLKKMKYNCIILLFCFGILSSQTKKIDTINFEFSKSEYDSIAKNYVERMIEINKGYKNTTGKNDPFFDQIFDGNINDLEIVAHPIFSFKTNIKDDDGKTNLIRYIDFKNDIYNQDFDIYLKKEKKWILGFRMTKEEYFKIMDSKNIKEYFGKLFIPKRPVIFFNSTNYLYLFKNDFSFYINDNYCVLVNNILSIITDISIPKHIEIQEFNNYFFPELNKLKEEAKGVKNPRYSDYVFTGSIIPTVLKVTFK